jgi:hypothetical protein
LSLKVLVEFDGNTWEYRQWIKIYEQTKAFFVENTIVWATRVFRGGSTHRTTALSWPALVGSLCICDVFYFFKTATRNPPMPLSH